LSVAERLRGPSVEVVSHRSAARLHGLGDVDADLAEFTVAGRRQTRDPEVRYHRGDVLGDAWTVVDGLPVTTVVRTVVDLARARVDGGHLAGVVRDAITIHHIEPAVLAGVLNDHAHRYGSPDGGALVDDLVHQAGLPSAVVAVVRPATDPRLPEVFARSAGTPPSAVWPAAPEATREPGRSVGTVLPAEPERSRQTSGPRTGVPEQELHRQFLAQRLLARVFGSDSKRACSKGGPAGRSGCLALASARTSI
jgi:hypothetical protein